MPPTQPTNFANFRKPPTASARPAATAASLPGPGKLPMAPGSLIRLTAAEAKGLGDLGWTPEDPVPANLPEIIEQHAASARNVHGMLPVDPNTTPVTLDGTIDISALPAHRRAALLNEVQGMIQRDKSVQRTFADRGDQPLPPGVDAALALSARMVAKPAARPQAAPQGKPTLAQAVGKVSDNLQQSPPQTFTAPPGGWSAGPPRGEEVDLNLSNDPRENLRLLAAQQAARQAPQQEEAAPAVEEEPAQSPGTGAYEENCRHCGWPHDRPDEIEPSPADKYYYLAMMLGTDGDTRFRKEVPLLGGAVVVNFRSMLSIESDLVWSQIAADRKAGKFETMYEQLDLIQRYRMAASIESLEYRSGGVVRVPEPMTIAPSGGDTAIVDISDWINREVLVSEHLRMSVLGAFTKFQGLCEKMEANSQNQDFWEGIAAPR